VVDYLDAPFEETLSHYEGREGHKAGITETASNLKKLLLRALRVLGRHNSRVYLSAGSQTSRDWRNRRLRSGALTGYAKFTVTIWESAVYHICVKSSGKKTRHFSMERLRLTLSCNEYDRTRFLVDGTVKAEGIDLTVVSLPSEERHRRFSANLEFDVCELQVGVFLGWMARGAPLHRGSGVPTP
jgi:hypothetical protein